MYCIDGSMDGSRDACPAPWGPNSFIFMQFSAKKLHAPNHTHPQQPCTPPTSHHACPPATMHALQQPHVPPSNHAHPLQPCTPPATMHAPGSHTCPQQPCMPLATMHAPQQPCMPPPPSNHACPPATMHAPPATTHTPLVTTHAPL